MVIIGLAWCSAAISQDDIERLVEDNLLVSTGLPRIAVGVDESLQYIGRHPIRIGEVAAGERFVFADRDSGKVSRLFIAQLEGFLPGVDDEYRYDLSNSPVVAGYPFRSNAYAFNFNESVRNEPTKESASTSRFLAEKGLTAPTVWMMWRSLTVAGDDRRHEMILFYIEGVEENDLTLDDLYQDGSSTERWRDIQQDLERRANESFRLAELDSSNQPIDSTWAEIPHRYRK